MMRANAAGSRDELWRAFVLAYDVEVPQDEVEEEIYLVRADMKHRMIYEQMSGGEPHLFPDMELEAQKEQIVEAAVFEVKEPRVLKAVIAEQGIEATPEELLAEAEAMAAREGSTLDMLRRFFGDDFSGLAGDVRRRKAIDWAVAQAG